MHHVAMSARQADTLLLPMQDVQMAGQVIAAIGAIGLVVSFFAAVVFFVLWAAIAASHPDVLCRSVLMHKVPKARAHHLGFPCWVWSLVAT